MEASEHVQRPAPINDKRAELMKIAEMAVQCSDGCLRMAYNEEDESKDHVADAAHFLKLDEKRLGRDIELYGFMGDGPFGWEETLAMFLEEILLRLRNRCPESYEKAGDMLRTLGESVYSAEYIKLWRDLF